MAKKRSKSKTKAESASKAAAPKSTSAFKSKAPRLGWRSILPQMAVLAAVCFALYLQTLPFEFVLDDAIVLSENEFVKKGVAGWSDLIARESMTGYFGQQQDLVVGARYRPLSLMTFALEHDAFGLEARYYHLGNVIWYTLCTLLVFLLFAYLYPPGKGLDAWWNIPFVLALLYALHPLHTEAVANIKGRDEILTMLFSVAALLLSIRFLDTRKWWLLGVAAGCFMLGLLAKENAITFLAVIPLFMWHYRKAGAREMASVVVPLLAVVAVYIGMRYNAVGYLLDSGKTVDSLMNNPFVDATTSEKYATIFYTLGLYIKLNFFPHPLTHDYYPYQIPLVGWSDFRAFIPLMVYLAGTAFAIWKLRSGNIYALAIAYFLITLSIVSNIVFPIGTFMNERFMFMPSLAFCLVIAWFAVKELPLLTANPGLAKGLAFALVGLYCIGFAWRTYTRIPVWENPKVLNEAAFAVSKNSARANQFMGYYYYEEATAATGSDSKMELYAKAEDCVDKALEIYPEYLDALRTKAGIRAGYYQLDRNLPPLLEDFYQLSRVRRIEYIETYLKYLNGRADRSVLMPFYHRIAMDLWLGEKNDYNMAYHYLLIGQEMDPSDFQLNKDLARIGQIAGNTDLVVKYGELAHQKQPADREVRQMLIEAHTKRGDLQRAGMY